MRKGKGCNLRRVSVWIRGWTGLTDILHRGGRRKAEKGRSILEHKAKGETGKKLKDLPNGTEPVKMYHRRSYGGHEKVNANLPGQR